MNKILDAVAGNKLEVKVHAIDEVRRSTEAALRAGAAVTHGALAVKLFDKA